MTDDSDPGANLEQWQSAMQAEHEDAIANPDPDDDHRIEGVAQVSYRLAYDYDPESDSLERTATEQVADLASAERQAVPLMAEDLARRFKTLLVDGTW
jgi:hypothetical protein